MGDFVEGVVRFPDTLPCPQADLDLVPRERRYISDIMDVRNMRMFQQEFQATRNKISFIFTEEEAREFREWYENDIVFGGAWFYADWPILHKDKQIPYRFVGQPKYEWLLGANPGAMGRSVAGYNPAVDAVTVYKVTAVVELYEGRKVGKTANVFTSKIYPLYLSDDIRVAHTQVVSGRLPQVVSISDDVQVSNHSVGSAQIQKYVYRDYLVTDDVTVSHVSVLDGAIVKYVYRQHEYSDSVSVTCAMVTRGSVQYQGKVPYTYYTDDITATHATIVAGEMK